MTKVKKMTMAGLLAGMIAAPGALLAADGVSASLDIPVLSTYVWRGQVLNDEAVLQPSATITKGGFSLNYWQNFALTDNQTGDSAEFTEHDITVSYALACPLVEGATLTLGLINYDFPNSELADTREVYASYAIPCVLAPTLSVYYDFNEVDDFYANLGISHGFELTDALTLNAAASVGYAGKDYNDVYFGTDDDALNDVNVSLKLPIKLCEAATLTPGVAYTSLLDSDIEDGADVLYGEKDAVVGSLSLLIGF